MSRYALSAAVVAAALAAACDEAEEPAPAAPAAVGSASLSFVPEALGIGARWYDYDESTHVLTPKPESYRVVWGDWERTVRIVSYYNADGESGHFTLLVVDDQGETTELGPLPSVKEAPVCVDLQAVAPVDCSGAHHLVLRSDRRAVPAAGFSVAEPALYVAAHRANGAAVQVSKRPNGGGVVDEVSVGSAFRDPTSAVLANEVAALDGRRVLQATADFRLCDWRVTPGARDGSGVTLGFSTRCVPLAMSAQEQAALSTAAVVETELEVPLAPPYGLAYVRVHEAAGPEVVSVSDVPGVAAWPDNLTFDLQVERVGDDIVLLAGPGALVRALEDSAEPTAEVLDALWE